MLIVRSVVAEDLDPLFELIQKSEYGLTTLKISKERLNERIEQAIFAFGQKKSRPNGQPYVFVMEDLASGGLVGTCAIYSKVGVSLTYLLGWWSRTAPLDGSLSFHGRLSRPV
jgi:arginine N-succinyltransferase